MKKLVKIGFMLLISAYGTISSAQDLWKGAQHGMSKEAVQMLFPNAIEVSDHPQKMKDGALGLLRLQGVNLSQSPFEATFYFIDGKLDEVALDAVGQTSDIKAKLLYEHLNIDLVAKYGSAIGGDHVDNEMMVEEKAEFISGETNIVLLYLTVKGANEPTLTVTYQTRVSEDSKNL
jgi:hypothetical protein